MAPCSRQLVGGAVTGADTGVVVDTQDVGGVTVVVPDGVTVVVSDGA